ncbi:hypothetical protein FZI24_22295 [Cronobacter sakazakii]|nr:hypothetical protein FZI24_22295 [Cronobacter sakazakii]
MPLRRGACENAHYVPLHGAGCLPVNSVPAPESAIITHTYTLIAPPHRGIHHASSTFNKHQTNQTTVNRLNCETFKKKPAKESQGK